MRFLDVVLMVSLMSLRAFAQEGEVSIQPLGKIHFFKAYEFQEHFEPREILFSDLGVTFLGRNHNQSCTVSYDALSKHGIRDSGRFVNLLQTKRASLTCTPTNVLMGVEVLLNRSDKITYAEGVSLPSLNGTITLVGTAHSLTLSEQLGLRSRDSRGTIALTALDLKVSTNNLDLIKMAEDLNAGRSSMSVLNVNTGNATGTINYSSPK